MRARASAVSVVMVVIATMAWVPVSIARTMPSPASPADAPTTVTWPATASDPGLAAPADTGAWGPVMDWGQQAKHMTMLSTGKVLVWSTGDNARVWDPTTGQFTLTPATFGDLHCAGQSTLADGRVIVVGGQQGDPHNGTNITALFDPVTETWTRGRDMTDLRWYATSTTLADGKVLVTSGDAPDGSRSTVPEVYDPATDTWTRLTGAARDQGLYPFMFVLPNGRTYEAGSMTGTAVLDHAGTGSWAAGPTAPYSTSGYSESAVMYLPGRILRAGGGDPGRTSAAVIDMTAASPSWRLTDPMSFARRRMNLTILADGSVMAIGGTASGDTESAAALAGEIWDPATEHWTTVAAMAEARMYHSSAVLLADGRIVVGGGEAGGRLRAQIYSPPYLFKGPRPTISAAPSTLAFGGSMAVTSPEASTIVGVSLIRPSAATHALDMNQRYVPLAFTRTGDTLTVTGPASGGVAPPGDYFLVAEDATGVPSIARFIRVGSAASLEPGAVAGQVTDRSSGSAVVGATVSIGTTSVTTAGDGTYRLDGIPAGESRVTVSASGYATASHQVVVPGGGTVTLDVALTVPGGLAGRVTDAATGQGIAGALVGAESASTTTDETGAFALAGLPSGPTAVQVSASGYASAQAAATVVAGETTSLDVALTPTSTYVVGEVRDGATTAPLVGATVTISTGATATTDGLGRYRVDLPPGAYTVTASAAGYLDASGQITINGGSYATLDFGLQPTPPADLLTFVAAADTHTKSTSPTKNYGLETTFRARRGSGSDATHQGYVRFTVSGLAGRQVAGATLRLYSTDGGPAGGTISRTGATWSETGLTAGNAPAPIGQPLATLGIVPTNGWIDVPLPAGTVMADGPIAFVMTAASTNSVYYASRQGSRPPELVLHLGSDGPTPTPSPSPSPSASPSPSPTPSPTATATPTSTPTGTPTGAPTATPTATPTPTPTAPPPGGGSTIKAMTFEGGLLHATSGADSLSGVVTLETGTPLVGTASARMARTTGYLQEGMAATPDLYVAFHLRVDSLTGGSPRIAMLANAGTTSANLVLTSTGRLRLRDGSTTVGADSAPLAIGVTYQVALHQRAGTGGNGIIEAFVAPVGTATSTPFARRTNATWQTGADRFRVGGTNGNAVDLTVDDVHLASGGMPVAAASTTVLTAVPPVASTATTTIDADPERPVTLLGRAPAPATDPRRFLCPI